MLMVNKLHLTQLEVKQNVAPYANDRKEASCQKLRMARPKRETETRFRLHFIPEWAAARQMSQADIVRGTDIDKGTVSRWFGGAIPRDEHLEVLCQFFGLDEPRDLFRHPDEDWMMQLLRSRAPEELERMRATLEAAFPLKKKA